MKQILATTMLALLLAAGYYQSTIENQTDFEKWSAVFGKFYGADEKLYREYVYMTNKKLIEDHNNDETQTYLMSENQFTGLTKEEFIGLYLNSIEIQGPELSFIESDEILQAVDWRNSTTVKAQGSCASGWAFSVSDSIEAWYKIRGGRNVSVSTQQLVDCDVYSSGCQGGVNYYAMYYVQLYGIVNSTQYPYVAAKQTCRYNSGQNTINNYTYVGGAQSTLQSYLQNYPVSVGVDAANWQFYSSGIFSNCATNVTNHYATAVGFDTSNNWIVQNSFGATWGEKGHIRLTKNNTCGILNQAYQIY